MKNVLTLLLLLVASFAFAQNGTVRGIIIDDTGYPAIGANLFLTEIAKGAATDLDGQFSMSVPAGTYTIQVSYIGFKTITIKDIKVLDGEVTSLGEIPLETEGLEMAEIIVTAEAITNNETALLLEKKKSSVMLDGISAAKIKLTGDATAVEAAKRVTGVSIEGGKYVYVRGLGDRYTKTTMNGVDVPGLDPDKNTIQMDIFPTNLIKNIVVSKNFTAEMPADFTGGLLNIETKNFPEDKIFDVSLSTSYNPSMHLNSDYLTYEGGDLDFLGFDDGARALPDGADATAIPTPISGASDAEVNKFISSFNPELGAIRATSPVDFSAGITFGNQIDLTERNGKSPKLGYTFSLSYKSSYKYYSEALFGEYQRYQDPSIYDLRYATTQEGELGERSVLIGALAGLAYKTEKSKIRLTAMHLQNGESRAGKFNIENDGQAVGQSGYSAVSDNLEYNQRSLTNVLLNGTHLFGTDNDWEFDWKLSPTISTSNDPDIRRTAFTESFSSDDYIFAAGAGGNPSRIWRSLSEFNAVIKGDLSKKHTLFNRGAKLKFGASHSYKQRNYEILFFDVQFFGTQSTWAEPDASLVLDPSNIYPADKNNIYYQSGNPDPNPNEYEANINNTALYISEEFSPFNNFKAILGLRAENFVQRYTGRDQLYASGNLVDGTSYDNEVVLESLNLFPSANLIYSITEDMNLRAAYSRTIARPSFKELSFAQILDPISNRIFNGGLFTYGDWDGNLVETDINNYDLRWEYFLERGEIISVSAFYKKFDNPIELVRIAEQQTSTEFQPRNVGQGTVLGVEVEVVKGLEFIADALDGLSINGNVTLVNSTIDMTDSEFRSRQNYERDGETIENTRQMAGQAPYVINGGITYDNRDIGLNFGLFYNVKGSTLAIVGLGLFPDVYYAPFHSLNFGINKKFGREKRTTIDFSVSNILNNKVQSVYKSYEADDEIFSSLNPGISIGLGISHKF